MKQEDILIWLDELATDIKNMEKHREMDGLVAYFDVNNFLINPELNKCSVFLDRSTFEKVIDILDMTIFMAERETAFFTFGIL